MTAYSHQLKPMHILVFFAELKDSLNFLEYCHSNFIVSHLIFFQSHRFVASPLLLIISGTLDVQMSNYWWKFWHSAMKPNLTTGHNPSHLDYWLNNFTELKLLFQLWGWHLHSPLQAWVQRIWEYGAIISIFESLNICTKLLFFTCSISLSWHPFILSSGCVQICEGCGITVILVKRRWLTWLYL